MSANNRALARLPLEVYSIVPDLDPTVLRTSICRKLQSYTTTKRRIDGSKGITITESVTTVGDLLQLSVASLMFALDPILTYVECKELMRRVCKVCSPKSTNAWEMLQGTDIATISSRYLQTGITSLDTHLRGGIRQSTITELVGPPGVGKTQIAMQLCIQAAKYGSGSVYIDTESKISLSRLGEIAAQRYENSLKRRRVEKENQPQQQQHHQEVSYQLANEYKTSDQVLQSLLVYKPTSTDELFKQLITVEEELANRMVSDDSIPIRLLVLDSIAAPARRDFDSSTTAQKAATVIRIAQTLKRMADEYQLAIVVINQVAGSFNNSNTNDQYKAALGTSWHHCVSTRIELNACNLSSGNGPIMRTARVTKSNIVAQSTPIPYEIAKDGVHGVMMSSTA